MLESFPVGDSEGGVIRSVQNQGAMYIALYYLQQERWLAETLMVHHRAFVAAKIPENKTFRINLRCVSGHLRIKERGIQSHRKLTQPSL